MIFGLGFAAVVAADRKMSNAQICEAPSQRVEEIWIGLDKVKKSYVKSCKNGMSRVTLSAIWYRCRWWCAHSTFTEISAQSLNFQAWFPSLNMEDRSEIPA